MLDNYRDLIDELTETPQLLHDLLGDHPLPDEAAIAAAIGRLTQRDRVVHERLQIMLRPHSAYFRDLAAPPAPPAVPVADALDSFDQERGELISLLMNLTLRDWERTAIDERLGEITVADEVERHVEFDEDQMKQVTALTEGKA